MWTATTPLRMWASPWAPPCAKPWGTRRALCGTAAACCPWDETLGAVRRGPGRAGPYFVYDAAFAGPRCGGMDTQMAREFFYAVSYAAAMNLHLKILYGANDHHQAGSAVQSLRQGAGRRQPTRPPDRGRAFHQRARSERGAFCNVSPAGHGPRIRIETVDPRLRPGQERSVESNVFGYDGYHRLRAERRPRGGAPPWSGSWPASGKTSN